MVPVGTFPNLLHLIFISSLPLLMVWLLQCSEKVTTEEVPADMEALVTEKRRELIEMVSEVDDKLAEAFLSDEPISPADLEVLIQGI